MKDYFLYLDNPAINRWELEEGSRDWENATPVGCGPLGAMIYGRVDNDTIQMNEERIWSGDPKDNHPEDLEFRNKVDHIRQLLIEGKEDEADRWAEENLTFKVLKSYETAGDLNITYHDDNTCNNYRREIDLIRGVANITYDKNDVHYTRTLFASYPQRMICFRASADKKGALSMNISYERPYIVERKLEGDTTVIIGKTAYGEHYFTIKMKIVPEGGSIQRSADNTVITDADSCCIYIRIETGSTPFMPGDIDWNTCLAEHTADFSAIMKRSHITFGKDDPKLEKLPVSKRLRRVREGRTDPGLLALYYQFGKYLMVSCSRPGYLPANLQGVWNCDMQGAWNSDYHCDINLQMNYWPVEVANISECHLPLFDFMNNNYLESGKETARVQYHCRGTVLHAISDIYGFTMAGDGLGAFSQMGGAWLCYDLWEHYLFTMDKDFLRNTAYNYMSESVRFFLDYMFEYNGYLITGPAMSPENIYIKNGRKATLTLAPTIDVEMLSGLFEFYIKTEEILGVVNPEMKKEAEEALKKFPPIKVSPSLGTVQEWIEDYEEAEPGHRHISPLFGLYPGWQISPNTPDLFTAAKKTIERRMKYGGGRTGWSAAWIVLFYCRLADREGVEMAFQNLLGRSTFDNMLDKHPPFQIDGNFGGCAGVAECVLQSHNFQIRLIPAVPASISCGSFENLMARGGVEVSCKWENNKVCWYRLYAKHDVSFELYCNGGCEKITMKAGETITKNL